MRKYEAMFIIKPDLSEEEKKNLFKQIQEIVTKNNGNVIEANIWSEKRKLCFPIKKYTEGVYYLMNFRAPEEAIIRVSQNYKINENILRFLITKII